MTESSNGDEYQPQPPTAEQVARRALGLAVVAGRGILELEPQATRDQAKQFWLRIVPWWKFLGIESDLEAHEAELLAMDFGHAPRQALVDASWRSEAMAVLAWALHRAELAPHDGQVDPSQLARSLGLLDTRTVLDSPRLRSSEELAEYSSVALTVHWRLRQFSIEPAALDFAKFCETAWFGPLSLKGVRLIEGDLAVGDSPISRAPAAQLQTLSSIARERQQAANWLLDASLPLSETDTST